MNIAGTILTFQSNPCNLQLLYFEQDANGGYGLALQVLYIIIAIFSISASFDNHIIGALALRFGACVMCLESVGVICLMLFKHK